MNEFPLHPYTKGFLGSFSNRWLVPISGMSPSLIDLPDGCRFHPRCKYATVGRLILRLIKPTSGRVLFDSIDPFSLKKRELQKIRPMMQMIFQDPDSSLDPRMKIVTRIAEPFKVRGATSKDERSQKINQGSGTG
ncbi:MAG: hypothetical protein K8R06_06875 [Methanosarcinales archaeon]|nr:hypothetical protein [Methanosarcinales archaeon]